MSRILRYQESINNFIQSKSSLKNVSSNNKNNLDEIAKDFDHLVSIFLVTILNNRCKKSKLKFHGYYIATGIDIGILIAKITDKFEIYSKKIGNKNLANLLPEMVSLMYQSLSGNIDSLKLNVEDSDAIRINQYCINYMSKCIGNLTFIDDNTYISRMEKTDFINYNFKNDKLLSKYKNYKKISEEEILKFTENKYGTVCKMSLVFGWILGLGSEKQVQELENIGVHMGQIFKISYDFENIDNDLTNCTEYTRNIVINIGIKKSVEIFMDSKAELIEGLMKIGIWSSTIKEILDLLESKIDEVLRKTNIDEKYEYSDFSDISSDIKKNKKYSDFSDLSSEIKKIKNNK